MSRLLSVNQYDDGRNAWSMTRLSAPNSCAGIVRSYCDYSERTGTFTTRRELPHAEGVLIWNLGEATSVVGGNGGELVLKPGDAFLAGPHLSPALSKSNGSQSGLQVDLPLIGLRRLFPLSMPSLLDRVVPLEEAMGREARALGLRLLEARGREARVACLDAALLAQLNRTPPLEARQAGAVSLLLRQPHLDISEVARQVGWSRKHLANRVHDAVGVGPRTFRRLLRFQTITRQVAQSEHPDWAAAALDAGYCDQSHLIRDFREFAGMTPTEFLSRSLPGSGGLVEA